MNIPKYFDKPLSVDDDDSEEHEPPILYDDDHQHYFSDDDSLDETAVASMPADVPAPPQPPRVHAGGRQPLGLLPGAAAQLSQAQHATEKDEERGDAHHAGGAGGATGRVHRRRPHDEVRLHEHE